MSLLDEILAWPPLVEGGDIDVLNGYLANRAKRLISRDEVEVALRALCSQELVERSGAQIWLSEPDRRELDLYGPLKRCCRRRRCSRASALPVASSFFRRLRQAGFSAMAGSRARTSRSRQYDPGASTHSAPLRFTASK